MVPEIAAARRIPKLVVLLAFTVALTVAADASVLGVGGTAPPTPVAPSGSVLATMSGNITTPTFSTDYTTKVFADPNNTFCSGCLDFMYQYSVLSGQGNQRFSMSSFAGFMVDAGTNPFGSHDPNTVSRSSLSGGDVISFNFDQFGNDIPPGQTTVQLVIMTNALNFVPGFLSAQDGTAGSGNAFQPAGSPVPEPTSLILLGSGMTGISLLLRKRKA
jgi:hypothetical protein